jgi:endonuclease/exonuclease/phosphatase family metal-dependent hydrolase
MRLGQPAKICRALAVTLLSPIAPGTALAAIDYVDVCRVHETSVSLPQDTIKVLTLNISHGRNTALNQLLVSKEQIHLNLDKIAALLGDVAPDIVSFQEADAPSRWSGDFDHVVYLAEQSGFPCFVHGHHSMSWVSRYGTALLTRSRPGATGSVRFSPSWPSKQKGFVFATFEWPIEQRRELITLASVHFDFLRASVRDQQVSEMVARLSEIDGALILMGDLNSEWGQEPSHVRALADQLNLHAFSPENDGLGTYKDPTGKRLDWILISQELEFRKYQVLPNVVADHFAVVAEIAYRGQHKRGESATSQD